MADKAIGGTATERVRKAVAGDSGEGTVTNARHKTSTTTGRAAATSRNHTPVGTGARGGAESVDPAELPIRPGEEPWTSAEVAELHAELNDELGRLRAEIESAEAAITGLMRDSNDGAGDDQVDAGTKNINRESELALANNARDSLAQAERALARLEGVGFGVCESCGQAVGKARLQAFPRATLCVSCKAKQERR
ncbi:TraR/DksA family transcriptional regulator [Saccharothrix sp. ST-888]|uniref:TraR/DksA family transcriptional regulator n=1 Tax=Saccharothrix sp. ST-888 TaxID=1427391 RepID=UPI000A75C7F4|nr:TraR/DksA family transcriptional regulator [Saccharothrix sp. ST-888]